MKFRLKLAFVTIIFIHDFAAKAELCREWEEPRRMGQLDTRLIDEASGLVASRAYPGRLYLHNDSGDTGPYLFRTNANGGGTTRHRIAGFASSDAEDMALGNCDAGRECLAIGDIGDNAKVRPEIQVAVVEAGRELPDTIRPVGVLRLRYPDGPHNAESLIWHPNGDLFIITKESEAALQRAHAARVYRLPRNAFGPATTVAAQLDFVGELDIPGLAPKYTYLGQIATSASLSADGRKLLILTYENALEFDFDIAAGIPELSLDRNVRLVSIPMLAQQEAIAYVPGENAFLYTTESEDGGEAPLLKVRCRN